jgi:hypothetical protein
MSLTGHFQVDIRIIRFIYGHPIYEVSEGQNISGTKESKNPCPVGT